MQKRREPAGIARRGNSGRITDDINILCIHDLLLGIVLAGTPDDGACRRPGGNAVYKVGYIYGRLWNVGANSADIVRGQCRRE